ncbi:hypothetical protein EWH99_05225 [Sporolactobacillus sp. THM7-7]|nr:hypothetical protein EWH99_05225 [Sporolactobacillus sp. THM7-7]
MYPIEKPSKATFLQKTDGVLPLLIEDASFVDIETKIKAERGTRPASVPLFLFDFSVFRVC